MRRFFVEEEGGYRVQKTLRDMCIFARQNFTGDPPFSRIDLISCRNVLIYLGSQLQQKALPIFHYALKPGGFLFLGASESEACIAELQRELAETRDEAQELQEQYEIANESLQAFNEEIQSGNEELQSINEELQTSTEELESTNEELTIVNDEMASRSEELTRLNNDLKNLQLSINTGIVLVGRDLAIRSFTPPAAKIFNLIGADVGRPLSGIRNLDYPGLEQLLTEVIDSVSLREREVQDKEGRWFSLRIRPYITVDNRVDGAVLMLVDIDALKRNEQAIAATRDYAEGILRSIHCPLVVLTADMRIQTANAAFYGTFKLRPNETEGCSF